MFRRQLRALIDGLRAIHESIQQQINSSADEHAADREEKRIESRTLREIADSVNPDHRTTATRYQQASDQQDRLIRSQRWMVIWTACAAIAAGAAAVGAIIYAHIASKQAGIMSNTLTEIQRQTPEIHNEAVQSAAQTAILKTQLMEDERPWLKIELAPTSEPDSRTFSVTLTAGKDLVIPVRIKNIGKTPAEDAQSAFAIQIASRTDELFLPPDMTAPPHVEHPKHWAGVNNVQSGAIFPDQFHDLPITYVGGCEVGRCGAIPISQPDLDRITSGKASVYIEGTATYTDGFRVKHWTRFCTALPITSHEQPACVRYNSADNNH